MGSTKYDRYAGLFADKDLIRASKILDDAARAMGVGYAVVGGSAIYLHTHKVCWFSGKWRMSLLG